MAGFTLRTDGRVVEIKGSGQADVLSIDLSKISASATFRPDKKFSVGSATSEIPVHGLLGILPLRNGCAVAVIRQAIKVGLLGDHPLLKVTEVAVYGPSAGDPIASLFRRAMDTSFLMRDTFFSPTYDLTTSMQEQDKAGKGDSTKCFGPRDMGEGKEGVAARATGKFTWNHHLLKPLREAGALGFGVAVVQGFVGQISENLAAGSKTSEVVVTLVARRDVSRAGTRHWSRGLDLEGNASNHVESEMIVEIRDMNLVSSFVQVRGSAPVLWSEVPNLMYKPKRAFAPADLSQAAFDAHAQGLIKKYQSVVAINLAGLKPGKGEGKVSDAYKAAAANFEKRSPAFQLVNFDFHKECGATKYGNLEKLFARVRPEFVKMGAFSRRASAPPGTEAGKAKVTYQAGVFRTNCIDSLDRTNVVQTMLAVHALENLLANTDFLRKGVEGGPAVAQMGAAMEDVFPALLRDVKHLWADHGDAVSRLYAGTGALKSGFVRTGKRSLSGFMDDGYKSLSRYYLNTFSDGVKQDALDLLLGRYGSTAPAPAGLGAKSMAPTAAMLAAALVAVGSWNLATRVYAARGLSTLTLATMQEPAALVTLRYWAMHLRLHDCPGRHAVPCLLHCHLSPGISLARRSG